MPIHPESVLKEKPPQLGNKQQHRNYRKPTCSNKDPPEPKNKHIRLFFFKFHPHSTWEAEDNSFFFFLIFFHSSIWYVCHRLNGHELEQTPGDSEGREA